MTLFVVLVEDPFSGLCVKKLITADNWKEALSKHPSYIDPDGRKDVSWLSDNLEEAKKEARKEDIVFDMRLPRI